MEKATVKTMIEIAQDQLDYGREYCLKIHDCSLPADGLALAEWLKELRRLV